VNDSEKGVFHWRDPMPEGTMGNPFAANAWFQFTWISNQMATPKILVCPADREKSLSEAINWGAGPGGFVNSAYRGNAVSYWVGADAGQIYNPMGATVSLEKAQSHVIFGDRNIRYDGRSTCSIGVPNVWQITTRPSFGMSTWTNSIHGRKGNLALGDGSVATTVYGAFTNMMSLGDDNGSVHCLTQ
jgi:prepilin-type processing-associated H-X9-DG protein